MNRHLEFAKNQKRSPDWGLIRILPERLRHGEDACKQNKAFVYNAYIQRDIQLHNPFLIDGGEGVCKSGRTSQHTEGYINHVKQVDITHVYDPQCPGLGRPVPTWEHAATSHNKVHFADEGDSGSFIYDWVGDVLGLVIGGSPYGSVTFTPMVDVLSDIKKVTGAEKVEIAYSLF
ncbi:unnamed protein product [Penicillium salamii]|nr:unnamed protein product [Penicillium salamii]CAG8393588.1 unnamed protein product [Penicillium salamii]